MVAKKHNPPPGLDYAPITGDDQNISYGTVEADAGPGRAARRLEDVIFPRLYPVDKPDRQTHWTRPTAEEHEVLLGKGVPDDLRDAKQLCEAYHRGAGEKIQHLATIISIRFPEAEAAPPRLMLHDVWELSRSFGIHLCNTLGVAIVACMHVPARSWGFGVPHVHLIAPCRVVRPGTGFSTFATSLIIADKGRPLVDAEWKLHRKAFGYGE
jgi:hypothetical protein